jgi:hypothetical protein
MAGIESSRIKILPQSKLRVRVRRPSLVTLIASGAFPAELASIVWKMYEKTDETPNDDPESIQRMARLMEEFIPHVLVTPRIGSVTQLQDDVDGVAQGTIASIDLGDLDKRWLFFYGQGLVEQDGSETTPEVSAASLDSFPEEPARADARPAREPVRAEAVESGGNPEPEPASA